MVEIGFVSLAPAHRTEKSDSGVFFFSDKLYIKRQKSTYSQVAENFDAALKRRAQGTTTIM